LIRSANQIEVESVEEIQQSLKSDIPHIARVIPVASVEHLSVICRSLMCVDMFEDAVELICGFFKELDCQKEINQLKITELQEKFGMMLSNQEEDIRRQSTKEI
jgi:hypothetical protein